jgi:3-phosphoshikimate 1-carboxyvinyltransferase
VTGLLLALSTVEGESKIVVTTALESEPYVKITTEVMRKFGIAIGNDKENEYLIIGGKKHSALHEYHVERDWSQAAFFLCGMYAWSGVHNVKPEIEIKGMYKDSIQGDMAIKQILNDAFYHNENNIDVSDIPDIVPPLAVFLTVAKEVYTITNAGRLRLKESDRLMSVCELINNIGGEARIEGDSLIIVGSGGKALRGGSVKSYNDHRIAMAAAIASLICEGDVIVDDFSCINKSYPDFLIDFGRLTGVTYD